MKLRNIISAVAAAAVAAGAASFCAFAEDEPAGYVYFMAEKTTIGQGFAVEPVKVPYYEGETGLEVVERAAEIKTEDTGYGAFITAFADDDDNDAILPEAIAEVCPEITGRTEEGWLSAYDYTAESGWTYFVNDEYAQTGIADYTPADGDVIVFSYTVYGYGADLGVDNSSWGGAPALREQVKVADLVKLCADNRDMLDGDMDASYLYTAALEQLAEYEASQEDIDNAVKSLENYNAGNSESADAADTAEAGTADSTVQGGVEAGEKGSPSTGVEGVAVAFAVVILAGAGIALSKKQ